MQKKFIILPFILSLFSLLSAGAPDTLWTRTYGGDKYDIGYSVQQTKDGGFIIAGETRSFGISAIDADVYLIRTNSNGDTIWTNRFGDSSYEVGYSVKQTPDDGFIVAGFTQSMGAGGADVYLVRTDSNGDSLWTKTYGGKQYDRGKSIQQTFDGGFVIAGNTESFGAGLSDVYLIRTDSNGDTLWTKTYGGENHEGGSSVQQTFNGGFVIAGYAPSNGSDVYLIRTDSNGDTLWTKTYGGDKIDNSQSICQTNDSGFISVGTSFDFSNWYFIYLIRTNPTGDTLLWSKTDSGIGNAEGYCVQQTSDKGFIIAGRTWVFDSILHPGKVYIVRTDTIGRTLWTKTFGGNNWDVGRAVQQTSDEGFIIVGETFSFGDDDGDVYLIRLDKDSTAIQQEIPSNFLKQNDFIVSHNHGNITVRYTIPYSTSVKIEAYNTQGKLVKVIQDKFMQKGSYSAEWDSKRFGSGVYFFRLSTKSYVGFSRIVKY